MARRLALPVLKVAYGIALGIAFLLASTNLHA